MGAILYRCPNTGMAVQAWRADAPDAGESYEQVTCTACMAVHYVNPTTRKVLGADEPRD